MIVVSATALEDPIQCCIAIGGSGIVLALKPRVARSNRAERANTFGSIPDT